MIAIEQSITDITYSNIVDTTPLWDATTEFELGDLCRVGYYHYKSTYGAVGLYNVGNNPLETENVDWVKWEPSNQYACLDVFSSTKTTWTGDGIVEFARGTKNKIAIGNFDATMVKVEYLDAIGTVLSDYTQTYNFSNNRGVISPWTYGTAGFISSFSEVMYRNLYMVGVTIRVTFSKSGNATNCGYLIAGKAEDFGTTYGDVNKPDLRVGDISINNATFSTFTDAYKHTRMVKKGKSLINTPMLFAIDDLENSIHNNIVILGKITKCEGLASNFDKNTIAWTIEQNIIM